MISEMCPCPFCASDDILEIGAFDTFSVICLKCKSQGPIGQSANEAQGLWNQRIVYIGTSLLPLDYRDGDI